MIDPNDALGQIRISCPTPALCSWAVPTLQGVAERKKPGERRGCHLDSEGSQAQLELRRGQSQLLLVPDVTPNVVHGDSTTGRTHVRTSGTQRRGKVLQ